MTSDFVCLRARANRFTSRSVSRSRRRLTVMRYKRVLHVHATNKLPVWVNLHVVMRGAMGPIIMTTSSRPRSPTASPPPAPTPRSAAHAVRMAEHVATSGSGRSTRSASASSTHRRSSRPSEACLRSSRATSRSITSGAARSCVRRCIMAPTAPVMKYNVGVTRGPTGTRGGSCGGRSGAQFRTAPRSCRSPRCDASGATARPVPSHSAAPAIVVVASIAPALA